MCSYPFILRFSLCVVSLLLNSVMIIVLFFFMRLFLYRWQMFCEYYFQSLHHIPSQVVYFFPKVFTTISPMLLCGETLASPFQEGVPVSLFPLNLGCLSTECGGCDVGGPPELVLKKPCSFCPLPTPWWVLRGWHEEAEPPEDASGGTPPCSQS